MAIDNNAPNVAATSLVSQVISTWRTGSTPNAHDVLLKHPQLRKHHSLVLDLVYEEYCLRREAGERVVLSTFCDRFPTVRKSLRVLLATHECIEEDGRKDDLPATIVWPETETLFLGFFLIREIGRGAFAHVYLATEPALGDRLVVVKVSRRGEGEAETLGRLTHRNIVPVYSVRQDEESGLTAICMPYLGNGTLLKALDATYEPDHAPPDARLFLDIGQRDVIVNAIPEEFTAVDSLLPHATFVDGVVHIVSQLADALAYAHDAGICHRDLKPSNILLAPSGRPLLLDFNLSSDDRLQRTLIGGTLPYMPPEQLESILTDSHLTHSGQEPSVGDARSDIFSLGVILYELLTGRLPFGDQVVTEDVNIDAFRIMANQVEGCEPLVSFNADTDRHLVEIVKTCLQLEPENRYQTAGELAADLRARLTPLAHLARWTHRRRFLLTAAAVGGGFIAAAAGARLALRPPYAERRYGAGVHAFDHGALADAVKCFSDAHLARPGAYQPLFARGQVLVRLEKYEEAAKDLQSAYEICANGPIAVWAGYAFQKITSSSSPAAFFYNRALNVHAYETTCVLNNLGHNYCERKRYLMALKPLTRAIDLDPSCQTAYINLAVVYSELSKENSLDQEAYRQYALADIERAATMEPNHAFAHFWAAWLNIAHNPTPDKDKIVLDHLRAALDNGFERKKLLQECGLAPKYTKPLSDYAPHVKPVPAGSVLILPPHEFPPMKAE